MQAKTKTVYYCDHCKRHGLSNAAMKKHEVKCTLNPERVCRWHKEEPDTGCWADVLRSKGFLSSDDIEWLRRETGGCPACMLAALRQCGLEYHCDNKANPMWDYEEEVLRFREVENYEAQMDEIRDIESSWL